MAEYRAPLQDMRFLLNEVFNAPERWASMPRTAEVTPDLVDAILEEGGKIAENLFLPLNRSGDEEECQFNDGEVTTPSGFKDAYKTYAEGGWTGLGGNPEYGGQGMPKMLTVLVEEMMYAGNTSLTLYPVLSAGAALAIDTHASEELKQTYLPKLYDGTWACSMCLTEPHCGTDLGILRTKAEPQADGSYKLTGTKIFITGGEHDLTENIFHLVLAKLPDAPPGPKGISLFLVSKYLVNEDGSLGERNPVTCGSIEHKMGIKGSATCVMNFDGATGYLVGEPNRGLACMFTMMNYERLSIGLQGVGLGDISYQSAVAYAKDRLQSRSPAGPQKKDKPADPIIVHPDVRRMLLTQRAFNEGGRAFACYVGAQLDTVKFSEDDAEKKRAADLVALLTPVAKAFFTDTGLEACIIGQQVFGGHGYVREWGMEQFVRDARIAQIYEGTNGIQALDLAGRKVAGSGGKLAEPYFEDVRAWVASQQGNAAMGEFLAPLTAATDKLEETTRWLLDNAGNDPFAVGAASCDYLHLFGYAAYAWMWARIASAALAAEGGASADFYAGKLGTARFYMQRLLPRHLALAASVMAGSETLMALNEAQF